MVVGGSLKGLLFFIVIATCSRHEEESCVEIWIVKCFVDWGAHVWLLGSEFTPLMSAVASCTFSSVGKDEKLSMLLLPDARFETNTYVPQVPALLHCHFVITPDV